MVKFDKLKFEMQRFHLAVEKELDVKKLNEKCLPRNFPLNAMGSADVVIVLSNGARFCPVVTGKVQKSSDLNEAFLQLLIYQLAIQRPCRLESDSSRLLGFIMDYEDSYIIDLSIGLWTDELPFKCQKIERYRASSLEERISFFDLLLRRLTQNLSNLNIELLTSSRSPTIRFPHSVGTLLGDCTHILKLTGAEVNTMISKLRAEFHTFEFYFGESYLTRSFEPDAQLLLKICGSIISGGMTSVEYFADFLKSATGELEHIKWNHVAIFKLFDSHPFVFSITNYVDGEDCSKSSVKDWWKNNRSLASHLYYTNIYQVALSALRIGYFHWDIRPQNILLNSKVGNEQFVIIDWESVIPIRMNEAVAAKLVFISTSDTTYFCEVVPIEMERNAKAALVVCERLMLTLSSLDSASVKPTISPTFFIEQLNLEENRTLLKSCLYLESMEPFLDTLMRQVLVSYV